MASRTQSNKREFIRQYIESGVAVLGLITSTFSMSVLWRCALWLLAWGIILHLIFTSWKMAEKRKFAFKALVSVSSTAALIAILWVSVYAMWRAERAAELDGYIAVSRGPFERVSYPAVPILQVGDSGTRLQWNGAKDQPVMKLLYDAGLVIESTERGLEVSTTIRDQLGHIVVSLEKNHWRVSPDHSVCWDKNYTDDTLEVMDGRGHVVLQLRIFQDRVQIQGEWHDDLDHGIRVLKAPKSSADDGESMIIKLTKTNQATDYQIKPMFQYPSSTHWREFVTS